MYVVRGRLVNRAKQEVGNSLGRMKTKLISVVPDGGSLDSISY